MDTLALCLYLGFLIVLILVILWKRYAIRKLARDCCALYSEPQQSETDNAGFIPHEWVMMEDIGTGGTAHVFAARKKNAAEVVAIKRMALATNKHYDIKEEVKIHALLKHKNIIEYLGEFKDVFNHYIVLELAPFNNLFEKIQSDGPVKGAEAMRMIKDAADGLAYMHSMKIMHGDIKLTNLVLGKDHTVKLCDMGVAKKITGPFEYELTFKLKHGAVPYMAPEVCQLQAHRGLPTDVWSFGIVVFYLVCGKLPWCYSDPYIDARFESWCKDGEKFYSENDVDAECLGIIRMCLRYEPDARATMAEITNAIDGLNEK